MASAPPTGPGPLSPDGRWRWDGAQWVPATAQAPGRPRSRAWMGVLAGCAVVLVLAGAGAGFGIYSFVQGIKNSSTTCLPSDFPKYPGSTTADENFGLYDVYPGFTCHMVLESNDDPGTVTTFYESKLSTGSWQVTLTDDPAGTIVFQPARNASPFGTVQVALASTHTEITIDTYTSTCLLIGFRITPGPSSADRAAMRPVAIPDAGVMSPFCPTTASMLSCRSTRPS